MMKLTRTAFGLCAALWISAPVLAALGDDVTSVERDRASMKGELRVSPGVDYDVHEIHTPSGTVIREYVTRQGKVFAVSWQGPGKPDLRDMLGSYYGGFEQANAQSHYSHHHLSIQTPDVVVESNGHTRAFFGRAWAPALLPPNFSIKDIG